MKNFILLIFTILSSAAFATSDCKIAFDEVKFYHQSGVVGWVDGEGLKKVYPELETLTPEMPELMRLEVSRRGHCEMSIQMELSVFGLEGVYSSEHSHKEQGEHHEHGQPPKKSQWTSSPIWEKKVSIDPLSEGDNLTIKDIPAEKILLSASEGKWFWALRFKLEIKEQGKKKKLWEKSYELPSPLH